MVNVALNPQVTVFIHVQCYIVTSCICWDMVIIKQLSAVHYRDQYMCYLCFCIVTVLMLFLLCLFCRLFTISSNFVYLTLIALIFIIKKMLIIKNIKMFCGVFFYQFNSYAHISNYAHLQFSQCSLSFSHFLGAYVAFLSLHYRVSFA